MVTAARTKEVEEAGGKMRPLYSVKTACESGPGIEEVGVDCGTRGWLLAAGNDKECATRELPF